MQHFLLCMTVAAVIVAAKLRHTVKFGMKFPLPMLQHYSYFFKSFSNLIMFSSENRTWKQNNLSIKCKESIKALQNKAICEHSPRLRVIQGYARLRMATEGYTRQFL